MGLFNRRLFKSIVDLGEQFFALVRHAVRQLVIRGLYQIGADLLASGSR